MTKLAYLGALALAAVVALPATSLAQMYAFVNTSGEVMTMDAPNADVALTTAPNLHVHSGVMVVGTDDAGIVGDSVPGT